MTDIVRVLRILEYTGPRAAVEKIVERSLHGQKNWSVKLSAGVYEVSVRAATLGAYPEILEAATPIAVSSAPPIFKDCPSCLGSGESKTGGVCGTCLGEGRVPP